ncbi:MAG: type 2 glycerol-3-phosphate oxidase [Mycoplasmatales bacterium]|nr:type 2 glycerol-3-phosphate oxidase [Mycoplasmatales bacterium]
MNKNDVVIIGGGIIGGAISYQLARYDLKILVLERNPLLADETSKGNSGAIHGGFDPDPGKLEAKLNVKGNRLWREEIFKHLEFPRIQADSLILAFNDDEINHVKMLYERGITNKVPRKFLKILSKEEVLKKEPNINPEVKGALLCTSSWAIEPVKATLAFFGCSEKNGVKIRKNSNVTNINKIDDGFEITINDEEKVFAKNIINAAGHYADVVAKMAGLGDFTLTTRRGEYRILSRSERGIVNSICFMVPTIHGKGVIVAPMLDGRIMVGPTAEEGIPKEETRLVTREKYKYIGKIGTKIIPKLNIDKTEIILAGSRPIDLETNDFIIRYANENNHFINAAGTQSPALASAPAIALEIEKLLSKNGTKLKLKSNFDPNFKVMW